MTYLVSANPQGGEAWLQERAGRLNGSEVDAIYASVKVGEAAARRDLRLKLVLERVTGKAQPGGFTSADMQWGIDHEAEARRKLETATGLLVDTVGYCSHPTLKAGCSPDGLVVDGRKKGVVELKCPKSATHLHYLSEGVLPPEYVPQCLHEVWIMDADFLIFQSYDPRFPAAMQRFMLRIERKALDIDGHERRVMQFLKEVDAQERDVRGRYDL